jgi:hypothetical protein
MIIRYDHAYHAQRTRPFCCLQARKDDLTLMVALPLTTISIRLVPPLQNVFTPEYY